MKSPIVSTCHPIFFMEFSVELNQVGWQGPSTQRPQHGATPAPLSALPRGSGTNRQRHRVGGGRHIQCAGSDASPNLFTTLKVPPHEVRLMVGQWWCHNTAPALLAPTIQSHPPTLQRHGGAEVCFSLERPCCAGCSCF